MVSHRGFSAWITCEGRKLEEFKPEVSAGEGNTISCWIPSETGKTFKAVWKDIDGGVATAGSVEVDGIKTNRSRKYNRGNMPGTLAHVRGAYDKLKVRPFKFADLQITDDESTAVSCNPDLGTISLSLWRVIINGQAARPMSKINPPLKVDAHGPVHEKSKKAGCHVISYGSVEKSDSKTVLSSKPYSRDDAKVPYVKFVFKYRPLSILQANNIAPRSASVARKIEGDKAGVDEVVDEKQINALEDKLNALKSRKRKQDAVAGTSSKKVKAEQTANSSQSFGDGEVIDLT